jgi:general secretion pathway protein A
MYNAFYELQREPFHVTPDPDFLFPSPAHKEALAAIIYGIEQRKGFVAITGEVGVGKTTILRSYLDFADRENLKLIYVYNSNLSFDELVTTLLQELGVEERPPSTFQAVTRLHEALIEVYRKNQTVVLIIDEAQNIPVDTLESLRMLSNLETVTEKLIQIMLIGQPEFDELLQQHRLRQLRQRIAIHARIGPLTVEDSVAYLEHRLAKVALGTKPVFTRNALRLIAEASDGIPRNLNILSDNALITGYGYQTRPVNTKIVKEVLADRGFSQSVPAPVIHQNRGTWLVAGMASAAAVAAIAGVLALRPDLIPGAAPRSAQMQPPAAVQDRANPDQRAPASRNADAGANRETPPPVPAPSQSGERQTPAVAGDSPRSPPAPPRQVPAPPAQREQTAPAIPPVQATPPLPPTPRPTEMARVESPRRDSASPAERPAPATPPVVARPPTAPVTPPAAPPVAQAAPRVPESARPPGAQPRATTTSPGPAANVAPTPAAPAATPAPAGEGRPARSGSTDTASGDLRPPQQSTATPRRLQGPIPLAPPSRPTANPAPAPSTAARPSPSIAAAIPSPSPQPAPAAPPSVMMPSASGSGVAAPPSSDTAESLVARPLATLPPPSRQTVRAVRAGDTLWTMAEEVYGFVSPTVLRRVQDANPQIRNINVLSPGQEVVFPRVQESPFDRGTTLSESIRATGRN